MYSIHYLTTIYYNAQSQKEHLYTHNRTIRSLGYSQLMYTLTYIILKTNLKHVYLANNQQICPSRILLTKASVVFESDWELWHKCNIITNARWSTSHKRSCMYDHECFWSLTGQEQWKVCKWMNINIHFKYDLSYPCFTQNMQPISFLIFHRHLPNQLISIP